MKHFFVPAVHQVIVDLADASVRAGSDAELFAAPANTGLGTAVLPLIALAASLTAAVCVGTLIVAWLRKPEPKQCDTERTGGTLGPCRRPDRGSR
ncbi:hypothetical protein ACWGST_06015 [Agromyces sp. NPDC055520]